MAQAQQSNVASTPHQDIYASAFGVEFKNISEIHTFEFLDEQVKKEHCNRFKFLKTLDFISYTFSDVLFGQFVDQIAILKK